MAKKLTISPDTSYMLGIYSCNSNYDNISLSTSNEEMIERFVKIALFNLDVKMENMNIVDEDKYFQATIRNSKVKKLLDNALKIRDKIFKYKNEYSASYFAGIFDCNGAIDRNGIFLKRMGNYDVVLLERIGFHTKTSSNKTYIKNDMDFIMFITPCSIKAKTIRRPVKK